MTDVTPQITASQADRAQWDAALARYNQTKADCEAYDAVWHAIHEQFTATKPSLDSIDWREFPGVCDRDRFARTEDVDRRWQAFLAGEGKTWWGDAESIKARHRAALDSIVAYRVALERHDGVIGMSAAADHSEKLTDLHSEADEAVMNLPAPDLAALRWKIERFRDNDGDLDCWTDKFVAQTYADLARLIPVAG